MMTNNFRVSWSWWNKFATFCPLLSTFHTFNDLREMFCVGWSCLPSKLPSLSSEIVRRHFDIKSQHKFITNSENSNSRISMTMGAHETPSATNLCQKLKLFSASLRLTHLIPISRNFCCCTRTKPPALLSCWKAAFACGRIKWKWAVELSPMICPWWHFFGLYCWAFADAFCVQSCCWFLSLNFHFNFAEHYRRHCDDCNKNI